MTLKSAAAAINQYYTQRTVAQRVYMTFACASMCVFMRLCWDIVRSDVAVEQVKGSDELRDRIIQASRQARNQPDYPQELLPDFVPNSICDNKYLYQESRLHSNGHIATSRCPSCPPIHIGCGHAVASRPTLCVSAVSEKQSVYTAVGMHLDLSILSDSWIFIITGLSKTVFCPSAFCAGLNCCTPRLNRI